MNPRMNNVQLIGRLGDNARVTDLGNGRKVANFSVATDESWKNRDTGEWTDKVEWHRCLTFQQGLIGILEKHATKGRLVYVSGKLQTRTWYPKGVPQTRENARQSTEIVLAPGSDFQVLAERPARKPAGDMPPASADETAGGSDIGVDGVPF